MRNDAWPASAAAGAAAAAAAAATQSATGQTLMVQRQRHPNTVPKKFQGYGQLGEGYRNLFNGVAGQARDAREWCACAIMRFDIVV